VQHFSIVPLKYQIKRLTTDHMPEIYIQIKTYILSLQVHFAVPLVSLQVPLFIQGVIILQTSGKFSHVSPVVPF